MRSASFRSCESASAHEVSGSGPDGTRVAVTLGPAAHERLLVTQRVLRAASRSTARISVPARRRATPPRSIASHALIAATS